MKDRHNGGQVVIQKIDWTKLVQWKFQVATVVKAKAVTLVNYGVAEQLAN